MALIRVPQHRPEDLAAWDRLEREDAAWATVPEFHGRIREALAEIRGFAARGPCYASTSWGKDSVVVAHLAWTLREEEGLDIPLAWMRPVPIENPWCAGVRDVFLARWPAEYVEDVVVCRPDENGVYRYRGTFAGLASRFGPRWIGGLRGEESGGRARRMERGLSLASSCQPIGNWSARDVFAYLFAFDLPIHPVYAMTFGGSLDRDRIRTASPGGYRGTGHGRAEWEAAYFSGFVDSAFLRQSD